MTKIYIKLIAMSLALILSVSVVIMSSYAWLVLSGNPAATGIQVAIGGGNTILMAPNVEYTGTDKKIYNIPGRFSDKMNFSQQDQYAYLQELGNLTPVSTSNGIDWFLPTYYSGNDEVVQQGRVPSGALKDISEFKVDSFLSHANLKKGDQKIDDGNYIYLDFWVVAPGGDYFLRVSTGEGTEAGGSFVIDLLETEATEAGNTLAQPSGSAAATVRVGFLASDLMLTDETMLQYEKSKYFDSRFTALKGFYVEPNTGAYYNDWDRFTIYEPNGDYHPANPELEGSYVMTNSLELENGQIQERKLSRQNLNLTMQKKSTWAMVGDGSQRLIDQHYNTALVNYLGQILSEEDLTDIFYGKYLQGQISTLVSKGNFVKDMGNLIVNMDGVASESTLSKGVGGATDDVYIIKLERNVPQRIRMFIWLEGQDIDCVDSVSSARFAVNIELAGGDQ